MLDGFDDELLDTGVRDGDVGAEGVDGASVLDGLKEGHFVGHFGGAVESGLWWGGCKRCE